VFLKIIETAAAEAAATAARRRKIATEIKSQKNKAPAASPCLWKQPVPFSFLFLTN
jgi:hypothetical protein